MELFLKRTRGYVYSFGQSLYSLFELSFLHSVICVTGYNYCTIFSDGSTFSDKLRLYLYAMCWLLWRLFTFSISVYHGDCSGSALVLDDYAILVFRFIVLCLVLILRFNLQYSTSFATVKSLYSGVRLSFSMLLPPERNVFCLTVLHISLFGLSFLLNR